MSLQDEVRTIAKDKAGLLCAFKRLDAMTDIIESAIHQGIAAFAKQEPTKLYLDCEWNDWHGGLISMALVGEDGREWYEVVGCSIPTQWVAENVMPHLNKSATTAIGLRDSLAKFLSQYESVTIVTDWPEDIAHFCSVVVFGPGIRIDTPDLYFHCWRGLEGKSLLPHNALEDARANMLAAKEMMAAIRTEEKDAGT